MVVLFFTQSNIVIRQCIIHSKDPKAVYLLTIDPDLRLDSLWELVWDPHDEVLADITDAFSTCVNVKCHAP